MHPKTEGILEFPLYVTDVFAFGSVLQNDLWVSGH